ncbi:MAG: orotidine-5'-phosphate decarboxylase [Bacteroidales bacterium]|nr:orotidine-5'-phosphate decarboxylase [Bacteroidales bacterium]MDZ4204538.1 orotidine-5'-phosphate decarboxylase [Bacteroidales bacterium]
MTRELLIEQIRIKKSFLCIGLDSEYEKLPPHLFQNADPVFEFNKQIIESTHDLAVAYKPNLAFYESRGVAGWQSLEKTVRYLRRNYPEIFTIADAKRGDIGNTSLQYAKAFLDDESGLGFDAVTVAPYMGSDSVQPFMSYPEKWAIVLALTSNKGAVDFQLQPMESGLSLWQTALTECASWGTPENMMFVVGATQDSMFKKVRELVPNHFLLVPGVGAQGGSLEQVVMHGRNHEIGLIINASRSIIFASGGVDFASQARREASQMQQAMQALI